jgi:hypothetical protein
LPHQRVTQPLADAPACSTGNPVGDEEEGAAQTGGKRGGRGEAVFAYLVLETKKFCLPELASVRKAYGRMSILFFNGLLELVDLTMLTPTTVLFKCSVFQLFFSKSQNISSLTKFIQ